MKKEPVRYGREGSSAVVRWIGIVAVFCMIVTISACDLFSDDVVSTFADTAAGNFDYLIGGDFLLVDGREQPYVARLDASGSLDGSFAAEVDGPVYELTTLSWAGETRVLMGGAFSRVNDQPRPGVALLRLDGSLDDGFAPDLGPAVTPLGNRVVYALLPVPERGTVVVGGLFEGAIPEGGTAVDPLYAGLAELDLGTGLAVPEFDPQPLGAIYDVVRSRSSAAEWRIVVGGDFQQIDAYVAPFAVELNGTGDVVVTVPLNPVLPSVGPGERINYILSGGEDDEFEMIVSGNSVDLFGGYSVSAIYAGIGVTGSPGVFFQQDFQLNRMDGLVHVISEAPNGRILYGGEFTVFDEFPGGAALSWPYLVAYDEFGLDTEFPVTVDGPVYDAVATAGPATIIAGAFAGSSSYGMTGPGYLVRIDGNLEIDDGFTPNLSRTDGAAASVRVVRPIPGYH